MDVLSLTDDDVQQAMQNVCSYFALPLPRIPPVRLDYSLLGAGRCFHQHAPSEGYLLINAQAELTKEKGLEQVLEHVSIYWVFMENNLTKYKGAPVHLPHLLYYGEEEKQRILSVASPRITSEVFFGKQHDTPQRERLLRFVDCHYNELRKRVLAYSGTSGMASTENLENIEEILYHAKAFSMGHKMQVGEQAIYTFICQDYADLLSIYASHHLTTPANVVSFLRELHQQREVMLETIGNYKPTSFLNLKKFTNLVEQYEYAVPKKL